MFWTWNKHVEINFLHEVQDQPICLVPKTGSNRKLTLKVYTHAGLKTASHQFPTEYKKPTIATLKHHTAYRVSLSLSL